ncbi:hypothetical protein Anas_12408, partial [Armadillidium nasatum]
MDIKREVMENSLNVCDEVQEKDTKENPPSTSQENFQVVTFSHKIKQEFEIKEEEVDIPDSEDFVSECEEEKRVCPYFVTDGLNLEKEWVSKMIIM